jgi:hypothetical protein
VRRKDFPHFIDRVQKSPAFDLLLNYSCETPSPADIHMSRFGTWPVKWFSSRISRIIERADKGNHFVNIRNGMNRIDFDKHHVLLFVNENICPFLKNRLPPGKAHSAEPPHPEARNHTTEGYG